MSMSELSGNETSNLAPDRLPANAKSRLVPAGWWVALTLFGGLYFYYLQLASPLVPYMDTFRYLGDIHDVLTGAMSWKELWDQQGSVGLLYQIVLLLEWAFWGVNAKVTVMLTAVVWALLFWLYACAFSPLFAERSNGLKATNSAWRIFASQLLIGFFLFSPAGWEIWLLDLGFAQTLKNLIIAVYFYQLTKFDSLRSSVVESLCMGALGAVAILFVTYNWSYSFAVAALFVVFVSYTVGRISRVGAACVAIPIFAAQLTYLVVTKGGLAQMSAAKEAGSSLWDLIGALLYGAGSLFVGREAYEALNIGAAVPMVLGLLILITLAAVMYVWWSRGDKNPSSVFFAAICVFGVSVLGSIAVARGGLGAEFAAASRYFMDYQFILIGLVGLLIGLIKHPPGSLPLPDSDGGVSPVVTRIGWVALGAIGVVVLVGHLWTYYAEYKKAPLRAGYYQAQRQALLSAQANKQNADILQTNTVALAKAVSILQEFSLGPYRNLSAECNFRQAVTFGDVYASEATGRWMGREGEFLLSRCPQALRFEGYLPAGEVPRTLTLIVNGAPHKVALEPGRGFSLDVKRAENQQLVRVKASVDTVGTSEGRASGDLRVLGVLFTTIGR